MPKLEKYSKIEYEVIPSVQAILSDQSVLSGSSSSYVLSDQYVPSDQTIPAVRPIQMKERFGAGVLNSSGIAVAKPANTRDSLYADYDMDPKTDTVVPIYGDARNTYIGNVEVLVNGVQIPRSLYYIEPLTLGLHFTRLAITGPSRVQVISQHEYSPHEILEGVLILPSSKEIEPQFC